MSEIDDWRMDAEFERILARFGIARETPQQCDAIALFADVRGFTRYCARPDMGPLDMGKYAVRLLSGLTTLFHRGLLWHGATLPNGNPVEQVSDSTGYPVWQDPAQVKFLGDGAMLVWEYASEHQCMALLANIVLRCWLAKSYIGRQWENLPFSPPDRIAFGLAHGGVAKFPRDSLTLPGNQQAIADSEYVGFCINLASRLCSLSKTSGLCADAEGLVPKALSLIASQLGRTPRRLPRDVKDIGERRTYLWRFGQ